MSQLLHQLAILSDTCPGQRNTFVSLKVKSRRSQGSLFDGPPFRLAAKPHKVNLVLCNSWKPYEWGKTASSRFPSRSQHPVAEDPTDPLTRGAGRRKRKKKRIQHVFNVRGRDTVCISKIPESPAAVIQYVFIFWVARTCGPSLTIGNVYFRIHET